MDRPIMVILCSDLLALAQQRSGGAGWEGPVDLFNVLRMGTLREPASIVHGNVLRVVDNKVSQVLCLPRAQADDSVDLLLPSRVEREYRQLVSSHQHCSAPLG